MTPRLRADLDLPLRIALWTAVVVVAVAAVEPTALYLPGSPLVGLATVGAHLALAHLAIRLTASELQGAATAGGEPAADAAAIVSLRTFGHGAAVLACSFGTLPTALDEAVRYVAVRLGGVLVGLGLAVLAAWFSGTRRRMAGDGRRSSRAGTTA